MEHDLSKLSEAELVDHGYTLKVKFDTLETQLAAVKVEVRERAKKQKADHFFGKKNFVTVSPGSSTSCDPKELYESYKDLGRVNDFFDHVKVQVGPVKKDLGETLFDSISSTETFPYRTVAFKENVPKKYQKK